MSARQISNRAAVWWKTLAFVQSFPQSHRGCHMPSICLTGLDGFLNACGVEPNTFLCVWKSQGIKTDVALLTSYCPILSVILLQSISGRISWVSTLFLPLSHMLCFLLSIKRLWLLKQYFWKYPLSCWVTWEDWYHFLACTVNTRLKPEASLA